MYNNSFFNPNMYQPYYQASNLTRGLGNINSMNSFGRAAAGSMNAVSGLGSASAGLTGLKGLLGKFSFSGFLNGASKTLNVVNQAIPIFYQVKPIINNARTMFRIMGAVKDSDTSTTKKANQSHQKQISNNTKLTNTPSTTSKTENYQSFDDENPTFFI